MYEERLKVGDVLIAVSTDDGPRTLFKDLTWHVGPGDRIAVVVNIMGRVRTCKLGLRGLAEEAVWIERDRRLWDARFDELDKVVEELKQKEIVNGRKKRG